MNEHQFQTGDFPLLTTAQLAQELGVHPQTIYRWHAEGLIPSLRLSSKAIRYCLVDVMLALHGEHGIHGTNGGIEEVSDV